MTKTKQQKLTNKQKRKQTCKYRVQAERLSEGRGEKMGKRREAEWETQASSDGMNRSWE